MSDSLTLTREWARMLFDDLQTDASRVNVLRALADFAFDGKSPDGLSEDEKRVTEPIIRTIKTRRRNERAYAKKRMIHTLEPHDSCAFEGKPHDSYAPHDSCASAYNNTSCNKEYLDLKRNKKNAPTREEVLLYAEELGCPDKAQSFMDFYDTNGWTCSNGRVIADWRAAFRYWISGKRTKKTDKPKRDYSGI